MPPSRFILPVIVVSQFFCTSLWFAGNGVINELVTEFDLNVSALSHLTSAVQLGFITGTLLFAVLTIADRFSPSKVFLICALTGALSNLGTILDGGSFVSLFFFRFATGLFLAGIYPVGMKIAADHFQNGLGRSLGYLVGALVVGTALPHLLKEFTAQLPWRVVLISTSSLAACGGLMMFLIVPDGPFRKAGQQPDFTAFRKVFEKREFRSAAFGYFGHMWELYAFWSFVPVILNSFVKFYPQANFNVPVLSFIIIGMGGVACVLGGYFAQTMGTKRTAFAALFLSCVCCLFSPVVFMTGIPSVMVVFLIFWGMMVVADSPLFSTLVAQYAQAEFKGTALTIVTSIGFAITIGSIQLIGFLLERMNPVYVFMILAVGPVFGLLALRTSGTGTISS
ncbi:MAG TPA: MFS transporter [Cyclobacteriaceae bacterium]|nr:MFS transporter [Cyclobacteriaceae bacterium]